MSVVQYPYESYITSVWVLYNTYIIIVQKLYLFYIISVYVMTYDISCNNKAHMSYVICHKKYIDIVTYDLCHKWYSTIKYTIPRMKYSVYPEV